jgi:hypothetical protein
MRSSDTGARVILCAGQLLVTALLAACSSSPPPSQSSASPEAAAPSASDCAAPPQQVQAIREIRRSVESGPLYALASTSGLASCRAEFKDDTITVTYNFRDGSSLRLTRSQATEYSDQEVRLATPIADDAVAVLTRAEQAAFDAKGCGIDWSRSETTQARDEAGMTERVYRGNVCNCQARARTDASGRVVRLQLRSAC